tara:strand:- start:112 stop:576 length:465 start_codon:yes stop_codon:yes gene_type:complete
MILSNEAESRILSNYRYNAIGGVDADRTLESGEVVAYTLTDSENAELEEPISGSQEAAQAELKILMVASEFKANRQALIDSAVVDANGFKFDADEISIGRMASAVLATIAEEDTFVMQWSLADTNTGVMTDITLQDLKLAHKLAVLNMAGVWGI